jgi:hypothetical protein
LGGDDTVRVIEGCGQWQFDENVFACLHGPHDDFGVERGWQAEISSGQLRNQ